MKAFPFASTFLLLCFFVLANLHATAETAPENQAGADSCPTAAFSIINNGQAASNPIRFSNESTPGQSYLWDFGDGQTSTEVNPAHTYGSAGTYTVKLTVVGGGCTVEFIGTEDVIIY